MKKYLLATFIVGLLIGGYVFRDNIADAFAEITAQRQSATATTSPAYIGEGVATTTWQFDNSNTDPVGRQFLFAQFTASSSPNSSFRCAFQFSNDNLDWYYQDTDELEGAYAFGNNIRHSTSTPIYHTWGAATTSQMGAGNDTVLRAIPIPFVASRYGRISCDMEPNGNSISNTSTGYSSPIGAANGAIWMEATLLESY